MTDASDYVESNLRDWYSQGTNMPAAPSSIYVGLHTAAPGDDGSSNEVSAGDYSRAETTAGSDWNTPANGKLENANAVNFGTTSSDWGTITHFTLWDAQTGGNCLIVADLSSDEATGSGKTVFFSAGNLDATIA